MSTESRPPTLLELPSYLAGHVSRIGHRVLVEALAAEGLRLPHFAVLAGLHDFGASAQHELADRLRINRSHLVGYLDALEGAELIARTRDAADRRRQVVALTERGRKRASVLVQLAATSEAETLSALTPEERRTLTELLLRVVAADDLQVPPVR